MSTDDHIDLDDAPMSCEANYNMYNMPSKEIAEFLCGGPLERDPLAPGQGRVLFGRDLPAEDKPALDAFFMMLQARYGRRAANAAVSAAEDAVTAVRASNRERGIDA
jgi:hypothetical protein